jgi:hypothetical protein
MFLLKRISKSGFNLFNSVKFLFHQKPRHTSVPTQSNIMKPFTISNLHDNPGAKRVAKRLGRGKGSGKG